MSAVNEFSGSKQRQVVFFESDMNMEIEKLLGEPSKLDGHLGTGKRGNGTVNTAGMRILGGRMRRFTESAAMGCGKQAVIHENGEWRASNDVEMAARMVSGTGAKGGKAEDETSKGAKPSVLVKAERLPYGKNSRHSRTGLRGLPKKGGAGGKGVWGKPGCELLAQFDPAALDAGDPNYDSEDQDSDEQIEGVYAVAGPEASVSDDELVVRIDSVLREFFRHANVEDCIESLGELPLGKYVAPTALDGDGCPADLQETGPATEAIHNVTTPDGANGVFESVEEPPKTRRFFIVLQAILLAFERHSTDRELASQLLAELGAQGRLMRADFACGFETVLRELADLRTDCPDAPKWTGMFLARAIDDQLLEHSFLMTFRGRSRSAAMTQALETCMTLLDLSKRPPSVSDARRDSDSGNGSSRLSTSNSKSSLNSTSSCLSNVWGVGGATKSVQSLVREMRMLVDEYLLSDDFDEALRCVRELDVPHFHHELVYQAVLVVLESAHSATHGALVATRVCTLLRRFAEAGVLPVGPLETGFRRLVTALPDLELDVPRAVTAFEQFLALCEHQSFVPRSVLKEMTGTKAGRKRYMSEADAPLLRGLV